MRALGLLGSTVASLAIAVGAGPVRAAKSDEPGEVNVGFIDPRMRQLPRRHRFRLGLEVDYVRLSQAVDMDTGKAQRFHWVPLQLDFAYQLQFLKYMMLRPSLAIGANVGNSMEAMPMVIHPQFHFGYQGAILGVALGYGWSTPPIQRKDAVSKVRHGLGEPLITNNHHVGGEISATTRIDSGALSFQLRLAGVSSRLRHFDLDNRRWHFMLMFNAGWYFGTGKKQAQRQRERQQRRERGRAGRGS